MAIPAVYFLYTFYVFLSIWGLFSLVAVIHLVKYGFRTFTTFAAAFGYMAISFVLLVVIFSQIGQFDWTAEIPLFEGLFVSNNQFTNF